MLTSRASRVSEQQRSWWRLAWGLVCLTVCCYSLSAVGAEEYSGHSIDDDYLDYGEIYTDYIVLSMNEDTIVLVLQIYWNGEMYYVCRDSLTLNAVKAFCRSSFYVDGGFQPPVKDVYSPLVNVNISCNGYESFFSDCNFTESTTGSACPSNETRSFFCSRRFVSFLDVELPGQEANDTVFVLDSDDEYGEMEIMLPDIRIGTQDVDTAYVYKRGLVSFGDPVFDPASVQISDDDYMLLFPFRWNTEAVASNYTTVRAVVHNCSMPILTSCLTPQMRVAWLYLYFGTDFEFTGFFIPNFVVIIEWRNLTFSCCPEQPVDFQAVLIGDRQKTYAFYTYLCPSGLSPYHPNFTPHPISGTVGVSIEDLFDREFRYSNTDYAVEMRCINQILESNFEYDWYNLHYDLTDSRFFSEMDFENVDEQKLSEFSQMDRNTLMLEKGSCVSLLRQSECAESSCCQTFTDPTSNCEVVARQGSCFCDGLCFARGDCCDDIDDMLVEVRACVPLCQEDQVNAIAGRYYLDGPVFTCQDGFPHFTDQLQWNMSIVQNTAVTCSNLQAMQDNDQEENEEGSGSGDGVSGVTSLSLPEMALYPVQFYFSCESGFEDDLVECRKPYGEKRTLSYEEIATVTCSADVPYCDEEGNIRLSYSAPEDSSTGIVEICLYGVWIPICGQGWNEIEASLACQQLGFIETLVQPMTVPHPGDISQLILDSFPIVKCVGGSFSSLQDCIVSNQQCSLAMVAFVDCNYVPPPSSTVTPIHESTPTSAPPAQPLSAGALSAILVVLVLVMLGLLASIILGYIYMKRRQKKKSIQLSREATLQSEYARYIGLNNIDFSASLHDPKKVIVADPELLKQLTDNLIINNIQLRLLDSIGQGEFGLVYKGHWFPDGSAMPTAVAIKTLKGSYSAEDVNEFLKESIRLQQFNHPNVMGLLGVCLDAGPTPYIVLPFMSGGSLLSYIKKQRSSLVLAEETADEDDIQEAQKLLVSMCHQVAKGMCYLAEQKFIHRDLAARNCMIDHEGVIKVADFGLSKNTYEKMYFRQDKSEGVKLPVKWMAIESMEDAVFSEKSDVWSYGVTCWEIFSGGKVPYPGISPMSLPGLVEEGHRMEKPHNVACSDQIYDMIMLRCWWKDPDDRPTFSDLESDLNNYLTSVAGYLDFNEFALDVSHDLDPQVLPTSHEQEEQANGVPAGVAIDESDHDELTELQDMSNGTKDTTS